MRSIETTCFRGTWVLHLVALAEYRSIRMTTDLEQTIDVKAYLASAGWGPTIVDSRAREVIFSLGDAADRLMYVLKGLVQLSMSGRHGVVGILGRGDCFGEECLAGHTTRKWTATAMTLSTFLVVAKAAMIRPLRPNPVLAQRFMTHLLSHRMQVEDELIDVDPDRCGL